MTMFPIRPHLRSYRGANQRKQSATAEYNRQASRVAEYLNTKVANDPTSPQVYSFGILARELGVDVDLVREAISDGGYNGISFAVTPEARRALEPYKAPGDPTAPSTAT